MVLLNDLIIRSVELILFPYIIFKLKKSLLGAFTMLLCKARLWVLEALPALAL